MVKRYDLLRDMECWRAERPDEWKMDEFMREVSSREADYAALESLNRELVEALEEMVSCMDGVIEGDYKPDSFTNQHANNLLTKLKETQ